MKKIAFVMLLFASVFLLSGCGESKSADIVTTMFPQYDFARQIVGDKMTVSLIIPPGVEIHDYDITSKDMVAIKESKLFIFTSLELNTWIENPHTIGGDDTIVLDLSESYVLSDDIHEEIIDSSNSLLEIDDDHAAEVHFWTDPTTAVQLIDAILSKVIIIDPENETFYTDNANAYKMLILEAHHEFEELFETYPDASIYFAGHNAMGAFGERYHLNIVSLFEAFKPDADMTSAEIKDFTDAIRISGASHIFIEELVTPKAAEKIIAELDQYNITLLELHAYHNITKEEMEDGVTYYALMIRNYDHLSQALSHLNV